MNPPRLRRLPLSFDVDPLLREVQSIPPQAWTSHFNADYHNGGWTGVTLRGSRGDAGRLYLDIHSREPASDTPLLAQCPGLAAVLAAFDCPLQGARLLRLGPGGVIELHRDHDLQFEEGQARLHIPLATNPRVAFYVDGEQVIMAPGECWYLDLSRPHRVSNLGATDRIHLVIDAEVNAWLRNLVETGDVPQRIASSPNGMSEFDRFREQVFADFALASQLRALTDVEEFVERTVALGTSAGCRFDAADVRAAIHDGRHRWIAQWIV